MNHFGMTWDFVKSGTSFKNLLMLAGSVPSYGGKKDDEDNPVEEGQHMFAMLQDHVAKKEK